MDSWVFVITDYTSGIGVDTTIDPPKGWDEAVIKISRNQDYHGIFFDYTFDSLQFTDEALTILENAYIENGIEANCNLTITWDCDVEQILYTGKFNFHRYKKTCSYEEGCWIDMPIENSDGLMKLKNRIDQKVDLDTSTDFANNPLTNYSKLGEIITLTPKGIIRTEKNKIGVASPTTTVLNIPTVSGSPSTYNHTSEKFLSLPFSSNVYNEFIYNGVDSYTPDDNQWTGTTVSASNQFIVGEDGDYTFDLDFEVSLAFTFLYPPNIPPGTKRVELTLLFIQNSTWNNEVYYDSGTFAPIRNYSLSNQRFTKNTLKTLSKGDVCQWVLYMKSTELLVENENYEYQLTGTISKYVNGGLSDSYYQIKALTYFVNTDCNVYLVNESLARVTEAITDSEMTVYSDYFGRVDAQPYTSVEDGCGSLECITKGLLIRNILMVGDYSPIMTISFKEIYEGLKAIHCVGVGMEEDIDRPYYYGVPYKRLRIEPFDYFYNATPILYCLAVNTIEVEVEENSFISVFKFGYSKYESEAYNGIDEFLTEREYRSTLSTVNNTLEQVSDFIASGYAIEVTRQINTTQDWRLDNDNFIICLERQYGGFKVEQGNIDMASNIIDPPTIYNYRISPWRNALRWFKILFANYSANYPNPSFKFTSGKGNYNAQGVLTDGCILERTYAPNSENGDINYYSFEAYQDQNPLWTNERVKFSYPLTVYEYGLIQANPYGTIGFSFANGDVKYGWISEINYKPMEGTAEFVLKMAR